MSDFAKRISRFGLVSAAALFASLAVQPAQAQSANTTFFVTSTAPARAATSAVSLAPTSIARRSRTAAGADRQDLARVSLDAGRRRRRGECARPHRQGPVAERQGHRGCQGRRRSAQRVQQPHQADRAQREGRGDQRPRRHAEPSRRPHRLAAGRHAPSRPATTAPARTGRAATQGSAMRRPSSTATACGMTTRRSRGTLRIPRAVRMAAAPRPTSRAPAATACCTVSRRTKAHAQRFFTSPRLRGEVIC